jgi:arylsulfatase A-like enzyme
VGGPLGTADLGLVSERDLAPTVLHLLGLPVSRELDGRVLEEALAPDFRAQHPLRYVAAYGRRAAPPAAQSDFDSQMLEELRSLGYIK